MANTHKHHKIDRAFLRAIKPTGNWQDFSDSVLRGESHPGRHDGFYVQMAQARRHARA